MSRMPNDRSQSTIHSSTGRPETGSMGLGMVNVSGRRRVPRLRRGSSPDRAPGCASRSSSSGESRAPAPPVGPQPAALRRRPATIGRRRACGAGAMTEKTRIIPNMNHVNFAVSMLPDRQTTSQVAKAGSQTMRFPLGMCHTNRASIARAILRIAKPTTPSSTRTEINRL